MSKFLILGLVLLLCGCVQSESDNQFAYLSSSDLAVKTREANAGDSDAAYRLSTYYLFWNHNRDEAIQWMRKSASYGNPKAEYGLGKLLANSSDPTEREEAVKWLKKAADDGIPNK